MRGAMANGNEILAARTKQGLTQEQLAVLADVDVKTVRKAEQGKRLDLGSLTRLAYALQTDLSLLVVSSPSETEMQLRRRDAVLRWQRAWDEQDHDGVLALYHDDAVLRLPGGANLPFGGAFHGKAEIRKANEIAWSTCGTEPARTHDFTLFVTNDAVILNGKKGINLPNGEVVLLGCVHIFHFDGDLVIDHQVEYDTLEFARLLQLPLPDPPPESSR